ncbi:STAS domain-containing protein [Streptomyces sp. NPDC029554]|uniref:STAS domain-containing protein n=1 Tax=Streptomyces sp. NPDC029554 TaxID=3155126 RepID=UPI0033D23E20
MNVTTTLDGTTAHIRARGEIDFDTLPLLRAAATALPSQVSDLQWDLSDAPFMDIAGLHLLFSPTISSPHRRTTVTGLGRQPRSAAGGGLRGAPPCWAAIEDQRAAGSLA